MSITYKSIDLFKSMQLFSLFNSSIEAMLNQTTHLIIGCICTALFYQFIYELYWRYNCNPCFEGKKIMITGASSGIGEELAYQLAKLKTHTLYLASRRTDQLERVKSKCLEFNSDLNVFIFKIDLEFPE